MAVIFILVASLKTIKENKLLLIDEFNRADMNKDFGEMFLAVEHGKIELREDEKPNGLSSPIIIPTTFRMICTPLNDYDKSLLNELSYGLLRRFAVVEVDVPSDKEKLKTVALERAAIDLHIIVEKMPKDLIENSAISSFVDFIYDIQKRRKIRCFDNN